MSDYLYGAYGHLADSVVLAAAEAPVAAVYIGTAPVNLVRGYDKAGIINTPVKIKSYSDAKAKIGHAFDWEGFTLSEAVEAHFNSEKSNVGPIYVINVLDPDVHRSGSAVSVQLAFTNGRATISSDKIILDTLALDGLSEGTDYTVSYDYTNGKVNIISADADDPITGTISTTYNTVDPDAVSYEDIIGEKTGSGGYTGTYAAELVYQAYNVIPVLYAAPGWSDIPAVYRALISIATKLNGHWDGFVLADIPVEDRISKEAAVSSHAAAVEDSKLILDSVEVYNKAGTAKGVLNTDYTVAYASGTLTITLLSAGALYSETAVLVKYKATVATMAEAVSWKAASGYTNERSKVFWPMAKGTDKRIYHLSTLAMAEFLRLDAEHSGVPFETCGNKTAPIASQYFGGTVKSAGFMENDSEALTSKGIATVVYWAGAWRLWGDSTAAYDFDDTTVDARDYFDVTMRMLFHITNHFQLTYGVLIDEPMTVQMKDTILAREQEFLDGLVTRGALIGSPTVQFLPEENSDSDLIQGRFRWDILATPTIPLKAATAYVAYTDAGLAAYLG